MASRSFRRFRMGMATTSRYRLNLSGIAEILSQVRVGLSCIQPIYYLIGRPVTERPRTCTE